MVTKPELKIDWATHAAAKYACENWHYSKCMPTPPLTTVGVWEDSVYIGAVIFSRGANNNLLKPYGLTRTHGCELTRIALRKHKTTVSRIVKIAILFLKKNNPKLRLIVSFADITKGHHGGIYQAGNWVYTGKQNKSTEYIAPDGKQWHGRMVSKNGYTTCYGVKRKTWKISECTPVERDGKYKYLYPLDPAMREQILPLSKPYPKRVQSIENDAPAIQQGEGGVIPTCTLHK